MNSRIQKSNVADIIELNGMQRGMLFHYLREAGENLYNVQLVFELAGTIDYHLLSAAFNKVQSHNEALRLVFNWEKIDKPLQIVLKELPIALTFGDLSHLTMPDADQAALQIITASRNKRFDLTACAIRVDLIRKTRDCFILAITHHHILYDGW